MPQPTLKPQDVLVLAKLITYGGHRPPLSQMATELSISSSEVHAALKRLVLSQLVSGDTDGNRPLLEAVVEFLSRIMAQIVGIRNAKTNAATTVYDPTCGSGSLLLKVGDEAGTAVTLYGQAGERRRNQWPRADEHDPAQQPDFARRAGQHPGRSQV